MAPNTAYGSLTSDTDEYTTTTPMTSSSAYGSLSSATAPSAYGSLSSISSVSSTYTPVAPSAEPPTQYGSLVSATSTSTPAGTTVGEPAPSFFGSLTTITTINSDGQSVVSVSTTTSVSSTTTSPANILVGLNQHDLQVEGDFKQGWYVIAMYVPSILAVVVKEAWSIVGSSTKLVEPFYRLNRAGGATAAQSLCIEYLASAMSLSSLKSAVTGNLHILAIIIVNLAMSVLAPLAAESMTVVFLTVGTNAQGETHPMNPAWLVSTALVRVLQAILSFVSACVAIVIILGLRRRSGLSSNPSSIASMATLLSDSAALHDIRSLDPDASVNAIAKTMKHKYYKLDHHMDIYGYHRFGLVRVRDDSQPARSMLPPYMPAQTMPFPVSESQGEDSSRASRTILEKLADVLVVFLIVGLLGVVVAYRIDMKDDGFNRFFNAGAKFGPRFVLSLSASAITMIIQSIEREVRTKSPYRRLAARHAPATNTILRTVNGTALTNLFSSLRHTDFFHFLVALTAVLGNILIIAVAGIPFNDGTILPAFYTSVYVTVAICVLMLIVVIWTFVWRSKNWKLKIPRDPNDVLIRVWMGLCNEGNRLRATLSLSDNVSETELQRQCRNHNYRYWAGWVRDVDGSVRWCVDQEGDAVLMG